jgi:hypothetical protein
MRYEYRIKVEECNNGKKSYIPQVSELGLTFCKRSVYPYENWKNLIPIFIEKPNILKVDIRPLTVECICHSEQEAEDIINFHKKEIQEEMERIKGEEIKNVYFIKK